MTVRVYVCRCLSIWYDILSKLKYVCSLTNKLDRNDRLRDVDKRPFYPCCHTFETYTRLTLLFPENNNLDVVSPD